MELLYSDIKYLPGVGEKRAELLYKAFKIKNWRDLLYFFPFRYVDRSRLYTIKELTDDLPYVQLKARIGTIHIVGVGSAMRAVALADDGTGQLELVWFKGIKYLQKQITSDKEYLIFGKPTRFNQRMNIVHPEVDLYEKNATRLIGLQSVYSGTEAMKRGLVTSKVIHKMEENLFTALQGAFIPETLPAWIIQQYQLMPLHLALHTIHFPNDYLSLKQAQYRLKFEELFYLELHILKTKYRREKILPGLRFDKVGDYVNRFARECLPFELTESQKKVVHEIRNDCRSGRQMNRLLQGDVGSGKTMVAIIASLLALDNGYQAVIMVPTEILAKQHFATVQSYLSRLGVECGLLTGSTKKRDRKILHEHLQSGAMQILIGTHAILEEEVQFANLGLAVIDEQHRFGVAQRATMWNKNKAIAPHILVMTATPIPRTLAMTLYGDLSVSVIKGMPPGRQPITTIHHFATQRNQAYERIAEELRMGRQCYIVYPLISESEKMDFQNLEDGYEQVADYFNPLGFKAGILHGKMTAEEKEAQMNSFQKNEFQILVSTTVIEVGVDVTNATVMMIESAERFGLSQLHQLRGRVGRGKYPSFCFLITDFKLSNDSRLRMEKMVATNNGFEIAEADFRLRGPGDIEGTQQSGMITQLTIANLSTDGDILSFASKVAAKVLENDPLLSNENSALFEAELRYRFSQKIDYGKIS